MDPTTRRLMQGAAGAGAEKLYVEDVFSTFLYTSAGTSSANALISNGVKLNDAGSLIWTKSRSNAIDHYLVSRASSSATPVSLISNSSANGVTGDYFTYEANGYRLPTFPDSATGTSSANSGFTYASWTFRKAAKFFDVVTYVGNGTDGRQIAHNLGSTPGCVIIKRTDATDNWYTYHRSSSTTYGCLNLTAAFSATGVGMGGYNMSEVFGNSSTVILPTSTNFTVSRFGNVNASGGTYVAYLFAHDAGGFGDSGNDSIISCGLVTANGSGYLPEVNLGWEPQWILRKRIDYAVNWEIVDNMRGMPPGNGINSAARLFPNTSGAEDSNFPAFGPTATGFTDGSGFNPNEKIIYIAIRRGPMKTPTDATKVFHVTSTNAATGTQVTTNFTPDTQIASYLWSPGSDVMSRLTSVSSNDTDAGRKLITALTDAEGVSNNTRYWSNIGYKISGYFGGVQTAYYTFGRAPRFFDTVAYTGDGVNNRSIPHNLAVTPELVIYKSRSNVSQWFITHSSFAINQYLWFTTTSLITFSNTFGLPTSTNLVVGNSASVVNDSGKTYIAYLFASCPGVSKVGSYTGTGTTLNVDCGFTAGARFVLIKRTDSTGDWYVWDTARGIVSGNDPYLLLNSTAAEVTNTDFIDPLSSGFQISSTAPAAINASGGSFIFLAVA